MALRMKAGYRARARDFAHASGGTPLRHPLPRQGGPHPQPVSPGQQFDEWRRIRDGHADIVVGSRSAVFAPLPRLGLIVVDEEHEWAYKQQDHTPRYHARDVALAAPSSRVL